MQAGGNAWQKEREEKAKRWIKREPDRVYMHACESLSTDSALGMSQWVTDMLEFTAGLQRGMHPSAGMSGIITPSTARVTDWTYCMEQRWPANVWIRN